MAMLMLKGMLARNIHHSIFKNLSDGVIFYIPNGVA
jgi:hypothetical protein